MNQESPQSSNAPVRRRLGRGLNALLGDSIHGEGEASAGADQREIDIADISPNPFQPRTEHDPAALEELAGSIRQHGVLQPVLVRLLGSSYQLIAGERRWRAAQLAGLERVPCRILDVDDRTMCEVALEENLKRKDLGVLEKAQAFQDYLQRFQTTIEDLGRQMSMDRSTVSNLLRLLELPEGVKQSLRDGAISAGHARALLSLPAEQQADVCRRIQSESLSVRSTEQLVRVMLSEPAEAPAGETSSGRSTIEITNHVRALADQLRDLLGAKVEIRLRTKDSGTVVIHFSSNDQFERVLHGLRRAA